VNVQLWKHSYIKVINNKNIYRIRTPYVIPMGKFYSNKIFYGRKDELGENKFFQDGFLFNDCLNISKTIGYLNKSLGLYRFGRKGQSTNAD
jgi:hypothetical protein